MLNPTSPLPLKDPSLFRQANCIDGKWVQADRDRTIVVKNPATGEAIGEVPALGAAETRRAIEAAHRAQAGWRAMLAKDRAAILRKLNDLMLANADDLAVIMTAEQGKPLAESKGEIAYAASFIEWFAEEGKRIYGDTIPQNAKGRRILVLKEPIGVFAAITPWNFPAAMITRKAGPGWAAGCIRQRRPARPRGPRRGARRPAPEAAQPHGREDDRPTPPPTGSPSPGDVTAAPGWFVGSLGSNDFTEKGEVPMCRWMAYSGEPIIADADSPRTATASASAGTTTTTARRRPCSRAPIPPGRREPARGRHPNSHALAVRACAREAAHRCSAATVTRSGTGDGCGCTTGRSPASRRSSAIS